MWCERRRLKISANQSNCHSGAARRIREPREAFPPRIPRGYPRAEAFQRHRFSAGCGAGVEHARSRWDGGEPAREWAAAGYPPNPGRLNALEHVIVKAADVPWRRARAGLGLFLHDELLKENIDGEAVLWAHQRLLARREQRRILIVVSDGTPVDEATAQANGFEYLDDHLYRVVRTIEQQSPIQLAAIGIGHDVSRVYANATKIAKIDQLGPALTTKLIGLLS